MTIQTSVSVTAGFDRPLIWSGGDSMRYLVVDVTAPEKPQDNSNKRKPLNLSIVIDASGSMPGFRLDSAISAARGVIESLHRSDALSIVSFCDKPTVHMRARNMDRDGKADAKLALQSIHAHSNTNLCDGYLDGAQCVAEYMEKHPSMIARVLLLSDGHANEGIVNPHELAGIARGLRDRGILSSTVGIGDGYSTNQIQAIAEHGGGLMHDAEHPEEIVEVVMGEFGEIVQTYAEDIEMRIAHGHDVRIDAIGNAPRTTSEGGTQFLLGSLVSGKARTVVLTCRMPRGEDGTSLKIHAELLVRMPGESEKVRVDAGCFTLVYARDMENNTQERDHARSLVVAERWQAAVVAHSLQLNREGRYHEAHQYISGELRYFRRFCKGLPGTQRYVRELESFAKRLERPMSERMRKDVGQQLYNLVRDKRDHRSARRLDWKLALQENSWGPSQERYRVTFANNHPVADIDGHRVLIGTGTPISVRNVPVIRIGGRTHAVAGSCCGMGVDELCRHTRTNVDVLLGNDILCHYYVVLDMQRQAFIVSSTPLPVSGVRCPFSFSNRVPLVTVNVEHAPVPMFLDTGAQLSYAPTTLIAARAPEGEVQDFYPGLGLFSTETYSLGTSIDGTTCEMRFGLLPPALQASLDSAGAQGILGNEVCRHYRIYLAFPMQELRLEPCDN